MYSLEAFRFSSPRITAPISLGTVGWWRLLGAQTVKYSERHIPKICCQKKNVGDATVLTIYLSKVRPNGAGAGFFGWYSVVEMQSSGPAARPGPKFRPGRAFCGARSKSVGLMPGSKKSITMYYALAAGLRALLERCWPGSMLGSADFVRCRSGLGLGFWIIFRISTPWHYFCRAS